MKQINIDKTVIFSDIHFGLSKNSSKKMETANDFITYLIKHYKNKADSIIFCGDYHHARENLNVHTWNQSYNCMKKLCNHFQVYCILGNHDTFFKYSTEVHSLKTFENIENLHIIEETTIVNNIHGQKILFAPWGFDIEPHKGEKYDYAFGHFDINGAHLNGSVYRGGKYDINALGKISNVSFIGHFHLHKEYQTSKGLVISVGSPTEQNWGELNDIKGSYLLDFKTDKYEFTEYTGAPKHITLNLSQFDKNDILKVKGNYIKLIIDKNVGYHKIIKLQNVLKKYQPLSIEIEYLFNLSTLFSDIDIKTDKNRLEMSKIQYCNKTIEKMELEEHIDKNKLKTLIQGYYNQAQEEI